MSSIVIRRGDRLDVPFLRSLLPHAYNWHVNALETEVSFAPYTEGWGRTGDAAFVAMDAGHSVGAAWFRLFHPPATGFGFVDAETPELTIVVVPSRQGEGIGEQLLDALLVRAEEEGHDAISVSVQAGTAEEERFLGHGFAEARRDGNTVVLRRLV